MRERVSAVEDEMTCEDPRVWEPWRSRQCGKVVMAGGCPRQSAYLGLTLPGSQQLSSAVLELSSGCPRTVCIRAVGLS